MITLKWIDISYTTSQLSEVNSQVHKNYYYYYYTHILLIYHATVIINIIILIIHQHILTIMMIILYMQLSTFKFDCNYMTLL